MSDSSEPSAEDDFLTVRARQRAESRERAASERNHLEVNHLTPMRELRVEWDAAWSDLRQLIAPVFHSWESADARLTDFDAQAIADGLYRVGRAIVRRDEISTRYEELSRCSPPDGGPPRTLEGRLAWVESRARSFRNEPPVIAAALLRFAVLSTPDQIARRVRMILDEPDDSPAFGWLPCLEGC